MQIELVSQENYKLRSIIKRINWHKSKHKREATNINSKLKYGETVKEDKTNILPDKLIWEEKEDERLRKETNKTNLL